YGALVLAKVGLLLIMLGFASVNRFWLTPRLPVSDKAVSLLCISTGAEITLGLIVICIVAVLGQLEPAGHMHSGAMSALSHLQTLRSAPSMSALRLKADIPQHGFHF